MNTSWSADIALSIRHNRHDHSNLPKMIRSEISEERDNVSEGELGAGPPLADASDVTDVNPLYQQSFAKETIMTNNSDLHLPTFDIPKEVSVDQAGDVYNENTGEAEVAMSGLTINKHAHSIVDAVICVGKVECYTNIIIESHLSLASVTCRAVDNIISLL